MASTSRVKTWNSGDTLTAADLNAEFNNLLTGGINNIQDANVANLAAIQEAKIAFSNSGHGHTGGSDGKLITVNRGYVFFSPGGQSVANDVSANPKAPAAQTATRLTAHVKTAPTGASLVAQVYNVTQARIVATVTISAAGTDAVQTSMSNAAIAQDDVLRMDVTGIGSTIAGSDLSLTLNVTQP